MALQIYLFGTPHCVQEGQPIVIRRRKAIALLAYLAVTAQPHGREALALLLWPDYDQSAARANLRRDLSYLKQALGDDVLVADWMEVGFNPLAEVALDVAAFAARLNEVQAHGHPPPQLCADCLTALTAAVQMYSGDFMAGFNLPDSSEFDEWQFFQREGLRRLLADGLQQLIEWHAAQGPYKQAIEYGRRWLALDPLHEPAHRRLMQLYAWDGQQAAALRQYEECVRLLDDELGVAPEAETAALYEAVRGRQALPPQTADTPRLPLFAGASTDPRGRYVQGELLAVGAHGEVYRGVDEVTGAPVAIKRLRSELVKQTPAYITRFQREGETLCRLNHPNIVKMLATFEEEGQQCIVMEYVPGGSLRSLLDEKGALPAGQVVAIGLELTDALSRAHHLGIIHRDIKPENVLLAADGTPRLTDFGVAQLEGVDVRLTQTGAILGSPAYMSPEALRGEELDGRSDVWSLAVLLFEMLAGERPFKGEHITAILLSVLNEAAPEISRLQPDVPLPLADLLGRMLIKERQQRVGSARLMAAELETIRAGLASKKQGQPAQPPPPLLDDSPAGNVADFPAQATPFIGREQELADVTALLAQPHTRLLTIVGPGGIGKTRLALAAADAVAASFDDGVHFIPLAPLKSAGYIPATLADSLDIHFAGGEEQPQQVINHLQRRQMLLILDNLEHLLDATPFISQLLAAAPAIKILVTSRERLNLNGEAVYLLGGMTYPGPDEATGTDVTVYNAVQLLLHHARLARSGLELKPADLAQVVRICQLVQGLPLALILAAGWVELLSFEEIAAEISQSLDFLETTLSDLPARQRSMRAVFESSWNQLTPEEQRIFARLSVFRGGFSHRAAEAVARASLRSLRVLVHKSLINSNQDGRYDIHELLRQYAEAHLPICAAEGDICAVHSSYYLDTLHQLEEDLKGRRQLEALDEIDAEFENVCAAWEWALQHKDEATIGRALESLHLFADMRFRQQEGAALFLLARKRLAPSPGQPGSRTWGRILTRGAFLRLILSAAHWTEIEADLEQALAIAHQHDDQAEIGLTLMTLGAFQVVAQADLAQAVALLEQSQACYQALADPFYLGRTLGWLAHCHFDVSGINRYYELLSQELALARQVGSRIDTAFTLMNLADAAIGLGDYLMAEQYIQEAMVIAEEMSSRELIAYGKIVHAFLIFLRQGDSTRSRVLLQEGWKAAAGMSSYEVAVAYALGISSLFSGVEPGKYVQARQQAEESLAIANNNGLGIILARWGLSIANCGLGNNEEAWQALRATIQYVRDFQSAAILTWLLPVATILLARQEQNEVAVELLALASAHPLSPIGWQAQWPLLTETRTSLEQALGREIFQAAWERGATLDLEQAIQWIADSAGSTTAAPAPPGRVRQTLPADTTPFLGREEELRRIHQMLANPGCRLLTIIGIGGMGKSRLAVEAARQLDQTSPQFRHGVFYVPLAGLNSADTLPYELANALDLSFYTSRDDPITDLINYLSPRQTLILLDNLEHLLTDEHGASVALLIGRLLQGCPDLKLLITSREPLQLDAEWQLNLDGLPYPQNSAQDSHAYPAVQLFLQAARQLQPDYDLTPSRELHVRRLCHLVSGIPLALKLAATWLKVMRLEQIVAETESSLDLLVARFRDIPPRQRSMRAIFDYTWNMLPEPEQRAFYALSLFRDSYGAAAALEVAGATPFVMAGLVDRGVAQIRTAGETIRYEMHELVRQYAASRVPEGEQIPLSKRYCHFYAALLRRCYPLLQGGQHQEATKEIASEIDNVRLAWKLSLELISEQPDQAATLIEQFTPGLYLYYYINGPLQVACQTFSQAAEAMQAAHWHLPDDRPEAARRHTALLVVQIRAAFFSLGLGDYERVDNILTWALPWLRTSDRLSDLALALSVWGKTNLLRGQRAIAETQLQESLSLFRQIGDRYHEADVLKVLGVVNVDRGDHKETMRYYQESLALFRELGFAPGTASILHNIGTAYFRQHDYEQALHSYQEARALGQTINYDRIIMESTGAIGGVQRELGNYQQAESHLKQSVAMARNLGEQRLLAVNLNGLGRVYLEMNELAAAQRYLGEGLTVAETTQNIPDVVSSICTFAYVWARQGKLEKALRALLFVEQQESARATDKERAKQLLDELEAELPAAAVEEARAWAASQTLAEMAAQAHASVAPPPLSPGRESRSQRHFT